MKKFFQSKLFIRLLYGLGVFVLFLLIFQAGVFVGYRKASFSYQWGEQYHRNFGGPRDGFIPLNVRGDLPNPNGVFGKIISINLPTFIVSSSDGVEKSILLKDGSIVNRFRDQVEAKDLRIDDVVVVIGAPNNAGQIEAKFIRIMPSPEKQIKN